MSHFYSCGNSIQPSGPLIGNSCQFLTSTGIGQQVWRIYGNTHDVCSVAHFRVQGEKQRESERRRQRGHQRQLRYVPHERRSD